MDSYYNAPHPHNRTSHLTKLYSDVKQSAVTSIDVKSFLNQQQATEQFAALHRKFRIQKDRLVTWGLEWDDEGKGAEASIDETVARAGLTETVTSVLANVKEVTDELEKVRSGVSKPGEKFQQSIFDEERYADLLKDLTASIDTLHDLSRTRRALVRGEHPLAATSASAQITQQSAPLTKRQSKAASIYSSATTLVEPPTFQRPVFSPYSGLPPRINPTALRLPADTLPSWEAPGVPVASRLIARLMRDRVPESVQSAMGSDLAEVPVLIEYADFDQAYRHTGVPPPLQRLEDISKAFPPMRPESQTNISLLGYFEDVKQPRIGLVYDLPYSVQNRILSNPTLQTGPLAPLSLLKMLRKTNKTSANSTEMDAPPLEARFKLALRLTEQLYMLHLQELPHGNINSSSVLFASASNESPFVRMKQLRSPMWASFDIFSNPGRGDLAQQTPFNIYQHPAEAGSSSSRDANASSRSDLYSFALLLVEIGLWTPLGDLYKTKYSLADFKLRIEKLWIPKLAARCGSAYMRAVQACIRNVDSGDLTIEGIYGYIFDNLRKCCALDQDTEDMMPASPFNEPEHQPFPQISVTAEEPEIEIKAVTAPVETVVSTDPSALAPAPSMKNFKRRVIQIQRQWRKYRSWLRDIQIIPDDEAIARKLSEMENSPPTQASNPAKISLEEFPFLEIPKSFMEDWNNGTAVELSKIVNKALKGTRESCSITLTSFGETLETARPTYLITCASTKIVKAMLKRHFKCDASACYVRVEKGKISRCRKARPISAARAATRSMAPRFAEDYDAVNPDYQPQPVCGASIGAYKDEEHLPPVSFGGIVTVDGKSFGMSVHHMLENDEMDDQDDDFEDDDDDTLSLVSLDDNPEPLLSDDGSTVRGLSIASDVSLDEEQQLEGDVAGIAPGEGVDIEITQPALDDAISQDLHADASEDSDSDSDSDSGIGEDHILSYKLGQVHASSGLKRSLTKGTEDGYKGISSSLPQEIDWALFELLPPRVQPYNIVKGGERFLDKSGASPNDAIPTSIKTSSELANASVYCLGRTSGLSSGVISSTMDLLKLQGRETFSASWTVHGGFGVGGDSGAWVVSSDGKVCGHVLAERAGRTYICPMDLLFDDMKATLGADHISLPTPLNGKEGAWYIQDKVSSMSLESEQSVPFSHPQQPNNEFTKSMALSQSAR